MSLILRALALLPSIAFRPARPFGMAGILALALAPVPAGAAIDGLSVRPARFSPNGDGVLDVAVLRWTTDAAPESLRVVYLLRVGVASTVVRVDTFGPRPAGPDSLVWDGRDSTGVTLAPDGNYTIVLGQYTSTGDPVDVAGNTVGVFLDTAVPPAPAFADYWTDRDTTVALVRMSGEAPQADSVTIYVAGDPDTTVRVSQNGFTFEVDVTLREGPNSLALESFDVAGNRSPITPAITVTYRNTADIRTFTARPTRFSPNGDGVLDTTSVQTRLDAPTTRLLVQVRPANPPLFGVVVDSAQWVRTLYDAPADSGDHAVGWDGRDSTGTLVADGSWYVTAHAESADVAGAPIPAFLFRTAQVTVDTAPPPVPQPNPPPPAATTRSVVVFSGRGTGTPAAPDTVLVWRGASIVARSATPEWDLEVPLALGTNVFTLQSVDVAGNRSALSAPWVIVYTEPLGFHAPERFRATDVFDVNVTRTARSVRLDLYELSGRRVRTLLVNRIDQRYELPWDLHDDAGRTVGDGPYVARVTVTYDDGVVETKNGAIVVAK